MLSKSEKQTVLVFSAVSGSVPHEPVVCAEICNAPDWFSCADCKKDVVLQSLVLFGGAK